MNKKIKILVVDDDDLMRETYVEVFKQKSFEVIEAIDGLEGLDKATQEIPDVIFTGIMMPKMDGFSLKEALAKNVVTASIPVVMSSHMGREEDRERANQLGVKEFIVKGMITPNQVVTKIKNLFSAGEYKIKFYTEDLDAQRLSEDLGLSSNFGCPQCSQEMVLALNIENKEKHQFSAQLICPNCDNNNSEKN